MERYLFSSVKSDLLEKMVFLGGPRQVGKTTLAKRIAPKSSEYLNWDIPPQRAKILARKFSKKSLWIFDEIHKYRRWRNYLKGLYDAYGDGQRILVTGSAKLDYYRFGGDSLQGRYHYLRLHPLSWKEIGAQSDPDFEQLLTLGGFPEPFLSGSQRKARRWSLEYRQRIVREEVTSLEQTQDLGSLELLAMRLPDLVGSPLSINSIREELSLGHKTVSKWVDILERLYHVFRVYPFGGPRIRAVKKEAKHYHFDWSVIPSQGYRFENLVGSHLLKWCDFIQDTEGYLMELRYFRDTDGREVDFVVVRDRKPELFVEVKWSETEISSHLRYLKLRYPLVRALQIVAQPKKEYTDQNGIEVVSAKRFLASLI